MTWPEDIQRLSHDYGIGRPQFTLIADPKAFYVFNLEGHALYRVGTTVEEAHWGVRNGGQGAGREHWGRDMNENAPGIG
jgi:hypothetical protein